MTTDFPLSGSTGGTAPVSKEVGPVVRFGEISSAVHGALSSDEETQKLLRDGGVTLSGGRQVKFGSDQAAYKEALGACCSELQLCTVRKDYEGMMRIGLALSPLLINYPQFANDLQEAIKEARSAIKKAGQGLSGRASRVLAASIADVGSDVSQVGRRGLA